MRYVTEEQIRVPDSLEPWLMSKSPEKLQKRPPVDLDAKLDTALRTLAETIKCPSKIYEARCQQMKQKADPSVARILEMGSREAVTVLDLKSLAFNIGEFKILMEMCYLLPNLLALMIEDSNLKSEHIEHLVEMAMDHDTLCEMSVSGNRMVAFSSAPLLLTLVKTNPNMMVLNVEGTSLAAATRLIITNQLAANRAQRGGDYKSIAEMQETFKQRQAEEEARRALPPPVTASYIVQRHLYNEKQEAENVQVRNKLLDHLEHLEKAMKQAKAIAHDNEGKITFQTAQSEMYRTQHRDTFKYAQPLEFAIASLEQLHVKEEELSDKAEGEGSLYTPGIFVQKIQLVHMLDELFDSDRERRETLLEEMVEKVKGHGPGSVGCVGIIAELSSLIGEDENQMKKVRDMLAETDGQKKVYEDNIFVLDNKKQHAYQEQDWRTSEEFADLSLECQEQLIDLTISRLAQLGNSSRVTFLQKIDDYIASGLTGLAQAQAENDQFLHRITHDLAHVAQVKQKQIADMELRDKQIEIADQKIGAFVATSQQRQATLWNQINKSFQELEELNAQKRTEIDKWWQKREVYTMHQRQSDITIMAIDQHVTRLEAIKVDVHTCENLLNNWEAIFNKAKDLSYRYAADSSADADTLMINEQKAYLSIFRRYWLAAGDGVLKREKRLEEMERQIRSCEFQIAFCQESLDPELDRYKDNLKDLHIRKMDIKRKLDQVLEVSKDRLTQFEPWEKRLRSSGETFESPVLEQNELQQKHRVRLLGTRQQFLNRDAKELVDKEKESMEMQKELLQSYSPAMVSLSSLLPADQAGSFQRMRSQMNSPQSPAARNSPISPKSPRSGNASSIGHAGDNSKQSTPYRTPQPPRRTASSGSDGIAAVPTTSHGSRAGSRGKGLVFSQERPTGPGVRGDESEAAGYSLVSDTPRSLISSVGPPSTRGNQFSASIGSVTSPGGVRKAKMAALKQMEDEGLSY